MNEHRREFWIVEFNHPTFGWCMVGYPMLTQALAQAEIIYRLCGIKPKLREKAAHEYRAIRYLPDTSIPSQSE